MADALPLLVSYVDAGKRYRFNNLQFERWFRRPRHLLAGRTMREVIGARAYAQLKGNIEAALAGRQRTFEMQVPYKGAGLRDVQIDYVPHREPGGKVVGFYALTRDITERKQAEARLRVSEKFNRAVLNSLVSHVAVVDRRGTILAVNDSWKQFARAGGDPTFKTTGVGANYLEVCKTAARAGDTDARRVLAGLRSVLGEERSRFTFEHEYLCSTPRGDRWFLLFVSPLIHDGGAVISHVDITQRKLAEKAALRQAQVLAQVHDAVIVSDLEGNVQSWNKGAERVYGYRADEVLGKNLAFLYFPEDLPHRDAFYARVRRRGAVTTVSRRRRRDGTEMFVDLRLSLIRDDAGHPVGMISSSNDITERLKAQEALRRSESNLVKAQQIANVGSYEYSVVTSEACHWSKQIFQILGLSTDKPLAPHEYMQLVHPDDRQRVNDTRNEAIRRRQPINIVYRVMLPNGTVRHVQSIGEPVCDKSGRVTRIVGTLLDVSERKRLEEQILETSEMEQRRIAQDLHDGLGQVLSGTRHLAAALERSLSDKAQAEGKDAKRIVDLLTASMEQTRTLARGLYPVKAEPNGLMLALQELAVMTRQIYHIHCTFRCPIAVRLEDNTVATHLYRIAQESINNAVRHGKARHVHVGLMAQRGILTLSVRDDGIGFRPKRRAEGMGIRIMRYRTASIGGTFSIRRRPNGGTEVHCKIHRPLSNHRFSITP